MSSLSPLAYGRVLDAGASHAEIVGTLYVAVVLGGGLALTDEVEADETLTAFEAERAG